MDEKQNSAAQRDSKSSHLRPIYTQNEYQTTSTFAASTKMLIEKVLVRERETRNSKSEKG